MKKLSIITLVAFSILACAPLVLVTPSQSDVDRMNSTYPDYSLAELNEGKSLYIAKCSTCHKIKNPQARTAEQWKNIVPKMAQRANKNKEVIDTKAQESILRYLTTMCTPPSSK